MATSIEFLEKMLLNANVQAALKTIRRTEGTYAEDGYSYLFTSSPHNALRFTDFSTHPNRIINANRIASTAAGAYQILHRTFIDLCNKYGFCDFTPHTQDLMCLAIFDEINVLVAVSKGKFLTEPILDKLSKQWASLPYNDYRQNPKTVAEVTAIYSDEGGGIG